jgi:titin
LTANSVYINGLSQGGSSNTKRLITLDGTSAGTSSDGLLLQGSGNVVSGLIIQHFSNGIELDGSTNTIGGTTTGAGNVISGNSSDGILIDKGIFGTRVEGNYVGTDSTGSKAVANSIGIEVAGPSNTVGGTVAGAGNVISGNTKDGILIEGTATGVFVQGNYIGTNTAGASAVGNSIGVEIDVSGQILGSTSPAARNIISGNGDGVLIDSGISGVLVLGTYIGTDVTGSKAVKNNIGILDEGSNTTIGGTTAAARNIISGNRTDGVSLADPVGALVQGNFIGADLSGSHALANGIGVLANGANSTIGGTSTAARNLISGNSSVGIYVGAAGMLVQGNYIGTDFVGSNPLSNSIGVETAAGNVTIGGTVAGAANLIGGNKADGVLITASGVQVLGNYIGVKVAGVASMANSIGVEIDASGEVFGGASSGARNLISGNNGDGVLIDSGISGVQVMGNYIGTDADGLRARTNKVGVEVAGFNDTIGGTAAGAGNLISGNAGDGVLIDSSSSGVQVQGNFIGTNAAGSHPLDTGYTNDNGIEVAGSNNTIGGTAAGARNIIMGNYKDGVLIDGSASGQWTQQHHRRWCHRLRQYHLR